MNDAEAGSSWILEPPGPDIALNSVEFSEHAELSPALRAALEDLIRAIQEVPSDETPPEVEAFRQGATCDTNVRCNPQTWTPCLAKQIESCRIEKCPTWLVVQ
jgi:hypothetical protein